MTHLLPDAAAGHSGGRQGRAKALAAKGTSGANPGVLGRSTLLAALFPALFLQLPVGKRQPRSSMDVQVLPQGLPSYHCWEVKKIKQKTHKKKPTEARR